MLMFFMFSAQLHVLPNFLVPVTEGLLHALQQTLIQYARRVDVQCSCFSMLMDSIEWRMPTVHTPPE